MVEITSVDIGSLADKSGIMAGDKLISINKNEITDVLDYRFYITEKKISLLLERDGKEYSAEIKKPQYDDIGLNFSTFLMDEKKSCRNKCIFCFIDQNPHGMRETVYFKDDDTRLSFLMGNYVTLTNTDMKEIDRIIKMRISPVNVSVHTTNPELRKMMLGNRFAGDIMEKLKRLSDGGISLNCQIVLCRGVNDGEEFVRSIDELSELYPAVESIAVVPAGLTKHRKGLFELLNFSPEETGRVIDLIEKKQMEFLEKLGTRLVFASDEMYIRASRSLPDEDSYEGYPQLDNGIGLIRSMESSVSFELEDIETSRSSDKIHVSLATGVAAYDFICETVEKIKSKLPEIECTTYKVENHFFGPDVTVAGLLTGSDFYDALHGKDLGEVLFIPSVSLRDEGDRFLDDVTLQHLSKELGVRIITVDQEADIVYKFLDLLEKRR